MNSKDKKKACRTSRRQAGACVKVYDLSGASVSQLEDLNREKEMWRDFVGKLYLKMMEREKEHLSEMLEVKNQLSEALKSHAKTLEKLCKKLEGKTKRNQAGTKA